MTRRTTRAAAATALAATLGLVAGCGGGTSSAAEADRPTTSNTVEPTAEPVPTPKATSGPLSKRQLPEGKALGKSWKPYAEPGGGETGVIGNGSSAQRREVGEVMTGLTPIGCPEKSVNIRLPRPEHALEGTYRGAKDAPGVSIVLQFAKATQAALFLDRFGARVDACPAGGKVDDPDVQRLEFERLSMTGPRLAALRRAYGVDADPARYLLVAVQTGDRVSLVYLAGAKPAERTRIADGLAAAAAR